MINSELQEVTNWFKANKLSVNASKTDYMLLGTNHKLSWLDESAYYFRQYKFKTGKWY